MYTTWLDALEQGEMAGVCMIDMSASFDFVDTEILLKKLKLYGCDINSVQWIWSYLTYRSQAVYIEGSISTLLPLEAGVPQGLILGPILYAIFTNELPQVVHEANCPMREVDGSPSSPSNARSVVGSAVMLMTAPTLLQEKIQRSCQRSCLRSMLCLLIF